MKGFKVNCVVTIVMSMFCMVNTVNGQIVIGSTFKPLTYDELVAPLRESTNAEMQRAAQERAAQERIAQQRAAQEEAAATAKALEKIEYYMVKYNEEKEKGNYEMSELYIESIISLNTIYNGKLIDSDILEKKKDECKKLQAVKEIEELEVKAQKEYNMGNIRKSLDCYKKIYDIGKEYRWEITDQSEIAKIITSLENELKNE